MPIPSPPLPVAPVVTNPLLRYLVPALAKRAREVWYGPPDQPLEDQFSPETGIEEIPPYVRNLLRDRGVPIVEHERHYNPSRYRANPGSSAIHVAQGHDYPRVINDVPGFEYRRNRSYTPQHEAAHFAHHGVGLAPFILRTARIGNAVGKLAPASGTAISLLPNVIQQFRSYRETRRYQRLWREHCKRLTESERSDVYGCKDPDEFIASVLAAYWHAVAAGAEEERRMRESVPELYDLAKQMDDELRRQAGWEPHTSTQ